MSFHQKLTPFLHALSGAGRGFKDSGPWRDFTEVGQQQVSPEISRRGKVNLADDDDVGRLKHWRIFKGFVFAFRYRQQDHAKCFTEVIRGRAYQVSHVLNDDQIKTLEIQLPQGIRHHFSFQVADRAGGHLDYRCTRLTQPLRIIVRCEVSHDDAALQLCLQSPDGLTQKSRFTGTGGRNYVQREQAAAAEKPPVSFSQPVIFFQDGAVDFNGAFGTRSPARRSMLWWVFFLRVLVRMRVVFTLVVVVVMRMTMLMRVVSRTVVV